MTAVCVHGIIGRKVQLLRLSVQQEISSVTQQSSIYLTKPSFIPDHKNCFSFNFLAFYSQEQGSSEKKKKDPDKNLRIFFILPQFPGISSFQCLTTKAMDTDKMFFKRLLLQNLIVYLLIISQESAQILENHLSGGLYQLIISM